jgi:hypothetical protein
MKNTILFKSLIDFLYIFLFIGIIGAGLLLPFGSTNLQDMKLAIENLAFVHWSIIAFNFITYLLFLRGLYFLRKVARSLLSNRFFTEKIITNLKKSGLHFVASGIGHFLVLIGFFINKIYDGRLEINFDTNTTATLFLIIIGMFFSLQSNILKLGKAYKEENDLTV